MSTLPYTQSCRKFSLAEIKSATQNFNDALVVGKGGFGKVYKATIVVENGETLIVAIKRLNLDSSQGATEFWAEIEMLTKLRHCNLVSLIGYRNEDTEMILIYEFMPHGTLDDHLHKKGTSLSWGQRLKISIGAARGLHYLHTGTGTQHGVIHRDVKSTNILLDEDYAAKISDFGLAKIGPANTSSAYVNTHVRGTFGYLDPEYFLTGRLTRKSDVFAFGVVLFELLCGRVAVDYRLDDDESSLATWAREAIKKGKVNNIIDLKIKSQISPKCLKEFVQIAYGCLNSESGNRPKMAEIVVSLERSLSLQNKFDTPVKPAAGISSIARMIKWPFISPEVTPVDQLEVVPSEEMPDCLSHVEVDQLEVVPSEEMPDCLCHVKGVSSEGKIQILVHELKKFSFDDLKKATGNFRCDTSGLDGFEVVFEEEIRQRWDGLKWYFHDGRPYLRNQHYMNKMLVDMTFSEFNHPNLVKVLGYRFKKENTFIIYKFMKNGILHIQLFRHRMTPLSWKTRVRITVGIAEALLSLKASSILGDYRNTRQHDLFSFGPPSKRPWDLDPLYYFPQNLSVSDGYPEFKCNNRIFGLLLFHILTGEHESIVGIKNLQKHMENERGEGLKESLRRALDPHLPNVDETTIIEAMKLASVANDCVGTPFYTLKIALIKLSTLET